jgi:hypothetical protein
MPDATPSARNGSWPNSAKGHGKVWRATDIKLGREVAIKVLPEAFAASADRMAISISW